MNRIISKVDYEMHRLGEIDPKLALEFWFRICKNDLIIRSAIEVIDINGEKCFRAPAICHMILSNPWDIDKKTYESFVMTILKEASLNKLSVFRNNTFLYLILLNGALGFDDLYLELTEKGIRRKTLDMPFETRKVVYNEVSMDGEKVIYYESEELNVSLTENEAEYYLNGNSFEVIRQNNEDEVKDLIGLVELFPAFDKKIVDNINLLHQMLTNEQRRLVK